MLSLFDLEAILGIIEYDIPVLLHHLEQWSGMSGPVVSCFASYLHPLLLRDSLRKHKSSTGSKLRRHSYNTP